MIAAAGGDREPDSGAVPRDGADGESVGQAPRGEDRGGRVAGACAARA
jgi:hypothetical protein